MATQPLENKQPVVVGPLTSTNHVLIDQSQSISASRWACRQVKVVHILTRGMKPLTVINMTRLYPIH